MANSPIGGMERVVDALIPCNLTIKVRVRL